MYNAPEEVRLAAVKQNGKAIKYIRNASKEVQLTAMIQRVPYMIKYYSHISKELQLFAMEQDKRVIQFINCASEELQLDALKQNIHMIKYIHSPSKKVQLIAVKQHGYLIKYISCASDEVQLASLWDPSARKYVTCKLKLPIIYYKWMHDKISSDVKYFKKNLSGTKKYFNIIIKF